MAPIQSITLAYKSDTAIFRKSFLSGLSTLEDLGWVLKRNVCFNF